MSLKLQSISIWILRGLAALILLQTLFFKFTASAESVYIFSKLGMGPWGRIGSGIAELIAAVLILIPRTTWLGAAMATGIMGGAIFFHLTTLGIAVQGDGGQLFYLRLDCIYCIRYFAVPEPGKAAPLFSFQKINHQ